MNRKIGIIATLIVCLYLYYTKTGDPSMMLLKSNSFSSGSQIPPQFTCKGDNISPQLAWEYKPASDVKSYVLIVDDPDAQRVIGKTFVHWIAIVPGNVTSLPEGASSERGSTVPGTELDNDFGMKHYGGPCPPHGTGKHNYRFNVYALSLTPEKLQKHNNFPKPPFTNDQFQERMQNEILRYAHIIGTVKAD